MTSAELDAPRQHSWPRSRPRKPSSATTEQRGGPRRQAAGNHGRPPAHRRRPRPDHRHLPAAGLLPERPVDLLEVNPTSIGKAIAETRQLLDEHGYTIARDHAALHHRQALTELPRQRDSDHPSPPAPDRSSDPALTGMSRADLTALIQRLDRPQAARTERLRHHRRGGERLPRRPRRRLPPEDHRRRTRPGDHPLPARLLHPERPGRAVRRQPPHHRQRHPRSPPAAGTRTARSRNQPRHAPPPPRPPRRIRAATPHDTPQLNLYSFTTLPT